MRQLTGERNNRRGLRVSQPEPVFFLSLRWSLTMSTEAPDGLDCLGCGNEFSASISLTISGGKHCDDDCKAKGEYCYAEAIEHQYPLLAAKMKRRQANQARALNQATLAVRRIRNYFIRIAKLGTLLNPADALRSPGYMDALKLFVIENYKANNDLQIFLESPKKVRFYRAWFPALGRTVHYPRIASISRIGSASKSRPTDELHCRRGINRLSR